jgi:hypothetical protein
LNLQARHWIDTIANVRVHGTTRAVPFERLPYEGLWPLDKPDYDTGLVGYRRSSRDCLISYEGNFYSVPAAYAQQQLQVRETERDELLILNPAGDLIAQHKLVIGRGERVMIPAHYQPLWPRQQGPTYNLLQQAIQDAPQVETRPLHVYDEVTS